MRDDNTPVDPRVARWLNERCGKLNASSAHRAFKKLKKGGYSEDRNTLAKEILAERMTGDSIRHYVTPAMEWGSMQQAPATDAYEDFTGLIVQRCEYISISHPTIENLAASPDGLVGHDGLIEIKCPTTTTFIDWRLARVVPDEHKPQMLLQLACTGRRWCDFVAFDPRIRGGLEAQLFIRRFQPDPAEIVEAEREAATFLAEVDVLWEMLTTEPPSREEDRALVKAVVLAAEGA